MSKELELSAKLAEIGAQLRQMREIKALTLDEVQASTLISKNHLQAIEEGNLDRLPEPVYIHGFIRKYGQAIGMIEIADSFPLHTPTYPQQTHPPIPFKLVLPEVRPWHLYLVYVLIVSGSVMFLAALFRDPPPHNNDPAPNLSQSARLEPTPVRTPAPKPPVLPLPTPIGSPLPQGFPVNVSVTMKGESWMRVTVDDEVAFEGILSEGAQQTWSGKREVVVRTGNAAAVSLVHNQKPSQVLGSEGEVVELVFNQETSQPQ